MTERRRIDSILVCGSGLVAMSAAVAFARALPHANVRLLALTQDPAALADKMPGTLPAIRFFHKLIGLDEARLFRQGGATHRLGTRFEKWRRDDATWFHAFGRFGTAIHASPFQHQWVRMHAKNRALAFDRYAPATALARADKFVEPVEDDASLLSSFDYALRLDPDLYLGLLADEALRARVSFLKGSIGEVRSRGRDRVEAVVLSDGTAVEADLFIDCSGPKCQILSSLDQRFEDWRGCLPCDRLVLSTASSIPPTPVDTTTATDYGWRSAIPLLSRTVYGASYSSSLTSDDSAQEAFEKETGSQAGEMIPFTPGRRTASWVGNVVAFGDAAIALDPLQSTNLTLAQSAIRRAIALLPDTDFHPLLLEEFNRRTRLEQERVRDFVSVHYVASTRATGEFWRAMADRAMAESLRHTLDQFESRGRLPKYEEETFDDNSWLAVLFGMGVVPRRIDPTVYRVSESEVASLMDRVARVSAELPAKAPSYPNYLRERLTSR